MRAFVCASEMFPSTALTRVQDPLALAASHHHELHSELSEAWKELNGLEDTEGRAASTTPQNAQYEKA